MSRDSTVELSTSTFACWPCMFTPSAHEPFMRMFLTVMSRETRFDAAVGAIKNMFCVVYPSTVTSSTVAFRTPWPSLPVYPPQQLRLRPAGPQGPVSFGGAGKFPSLFAHPGVSIMAAAGGKTG